MTKKTEAPIVRLEPSWQPSSETITSEIALSANALLDSFRTGHEKAKALFQNIHPRGRDPEFEPEPFDARLVLYFQSMAGQTLNLEGLKNASKKLLKDVKKKDEVALLRMKSNHPKVISGEKALEEISLVDCQHVLARENGYDSWPKLKRYLDDLAQTKAQENKNIDHKTDSHIRCGSDLREALAQSGFKGEFVEVINPFSFGPVYPLEDEAGQKERCDYIDREFAPYLEESELPPAYEQFQQEQDILKSLNDREGDICLWFEHDTYDQLCLAHILYHASNAPQDLTKKLALVQVDKYPGVKRFVGLGNINQDPEHLRLLYSQRLRVSEHMISFGARVWMALTEKTPKTLWRLVKEKNAPLPIMQNALRRFLKELPDPNDGLGYTEKLTLQILDEEQELLMRRIFLMLIAEKDEQPYLGDIMFFNIIQKLINAKTPAIEVVSKLDIEGPGTEICRLTRYGRKLLEGEANWLSDNKVQRWVGGTEVNTDFAQNWLFMPGQGPVLK